MSCLICNLNLEDYETVNVGWKGLETLIQCSIDRKDNLADSFRNVKSITLHVECRKNYTRRRPNGALSRAVVKPVAPDCDSNVKFEYVPISIMNKKPLISNNTKKRHTFANSSATIPNVDADSNTEVKYFSCSEKNSSQLSVDDTISESDPAIETDCESQVSNDDPTKPFPFQHNCFLCAKEINDANEIKKPLGKRNVSYHVRRESTKETILNKLKKNPSSKNMKILQRIQNVDLLQVKARYHTNCYRKLLLGTFNKVRSKVRGRHKCSQVTTAMEKIYRYIEESDHNEFTTSELLTAGTYDDYQPNTHTIKTRLEMKYKGKIYFTKSSGRSTIVTIIKGSRSDGSVVIQPWNLNSTEVVGRMEDVLKDKRKYYKTNKELTKREKCKSVKIKKKQNKESIKDDIEIKEIECNKETKGKEIIKEYNENDDDFIDDTFHPEEFAAENKDNILICQICLSSTRRLEDLGSYIDVLRNIGSDIFIEDFQPKLFLICWECIALLKNVKRFQRKIMIAQKLWNTEVQELPKCLSTLSITIPSTASVFYTDEKHKDNKTQECIEPEVVSVDFLPREEIPPLKDEKPAVEKIVIDYDTFDKHTTDDTRGFDDKDMKYDTKDVEMGNDTYGNGYDSKDDDNDDEFTEYQEGVKHRLKRRKARVKCVESDNESDEPSKSTYQRKSSSEDPDWAATVREKSQKEKKVTPKLKIPYTMIVQTYITETRIQREPIDSHELQYWLDTERNSDYFKTLVQKCMRCITEVPENHNELCHSDKYPYICDICESTFPRNDEKESHVANHYYIFSCEFCRYKCYNETHMRCHVESHRRLVQCLECFAAFETLDILKEHFNNLHRYAECDYCGQRFPHKSTVKTHIERLHTPQICTICNKRYRNYAQKMHHMNLKHRIERTEAAYCVQCDIQFDNVKQLKLHVYSSIRHKHEWKRGPPKKKQKEQHKCPGCPNVYAQKHTMLGHYNLVHAKKITFYCNLCNKPFALKKTYKEHMRTRHEGYKLPKNKFCHMCGRGFSTNCILANHIRTHTGERPFACPHCASSFAQKAALRSHIAHVHQQRPRTSGGTCTKRRQSNAQPNNIQYNSLGFI